jgi:hypothetical protein
MQCLLPSRRTLPALLHPITHFGRLALPCPPLPASARSLAAPQSTTAVTWCPADQQTSSSQHTSPCWQPCTARPPPGQEQPRRSREKDGGGALAAAAAPAATAGEQCRKRLSQQRQQEQWQRRSTCPRLPLCSATAQTWAGPAPPAATTRCLKTTPIPHSSSAAAAAALTVAPVAAAETAEAEAGVGQLRQVVAGSWHALSSPLYTAVNVLTAVAGYVNGVFGCAPVALPPSNGCNRRGVPGREEIAGK